MKSETRQKQAETDAGDGSHGICRDIDASRSPSPDPKRPAKKESLPPMSANELQPRTILGVLLGSLCGGVASMFAPDSVVFSAFCTTLGGTLFAIIEVKVGRSIGRLMLLLGGLSLFLATSYLCIVDPQRKGDSLFTSNAVRFHPQLTSNEDDFTTLPKGVRVTYLHRTFRRHRIVRESHSYFVYWRFVETENHQKGWIYGAYLSSHL